MTTLYGLSLKSFYGIDHTYVASSDGHIWSCWGRHSGGEVICSGEGSSQEAHCISKKKSHAGLLYGLSGVCHQSANRILYPAQCLVSKAKNYWITVFLYGNYGTPHFNSLQKWELRKLRCSNTLDPVPPLKETSCNLKNLPPEQGEILYLQMVNSLHQEMLQRFDGIQGQSAEDRKPDLLKHELKTLLAYRWSSDSLSEESELLFKLQDTLLEEKRVYDLAFLRKKLKNEQYAQSVNDLVDQVFSKINNHLGARDFIRIFGVDPSTRIEIINPEIMSYIYNK